MTNVLHHTTLGFCWLDVIAAAILLIIVAVFIIKHRNLKKRLKELEDQLSEQHADDTIGNQGA